MAVFCKLLAHPIQLEVDWRVALVEITFLTTIKNVNLTNCFIYTLNSQVKFPNYVRGRVLVSSEDFRDNATFRVGKYKRMSETLRVFEEGTQLYKPSSSCNLRDDGDVQFYFTDYHGKRFFNRIVLGVVTFKVVPEKENTPGVYFVRNNQRVAKNQIRKVYPLNLTVGTIFFLCKH